ncbi:MAG: hypothetical protein JEY99_07715 [Spirochaetales bacterium]|nr:hypothetical protein [Spirochaetales bacterium]
MRNKVLFIILSLFLFFTAAIAQESEDSGIENQSGISDVEPVQKTNVLEQYFPVEGLSQWEYEYDISDLEEGRYNLIVRGIDIAGNEVESTAVDIFIDPASDLPTASLTYPSENMRISGDLNLLGSAGDDDGVDFIEVQLEDGVFTRIPGKEYWSYDIPTDDLTDGKYKLTVRSTDINGVTGNEEVTEFFIDRNIPEIEITSHINGDLVSKNITIEGTIEDSNGVDSLLFSVDGGNLFKPAKLSGEYKDGSGDFSFVINTRELTDGPGIIWFKGVDTLGSSGRAALLLYIDNGAPVLDFLYPVADEPVNGKFSVMGRAFDQVGIDSLEYSDGGDMTIAIPLEPGNPYWKVDVDFTGEKKAALNFILKDIAGNVKKYPLKLDLDWEGDLPVVELFNPLSEEFSEKRRLQGVILDDDGPSGITYSLDRGEESFFESGRFFDIPLENLTAGEHRLTYRGRDVNGVEGVDSTISFHLLPGPPQFSLDFFTYRDGGELDFEPGASVRPDEISGIRGTLVFEGGKGSAEMAIAGGEGFPLALKKSDEAGVFTFSADFPEPLAYGNIEIAVTAKDTLGSEKSFTEYFWMADHSVNLLEHGFYHPPGDYPVDGNTGVSLRYIGYPLSELMVPEEAAFLDISRNGDFITIKGGEAGALENFKLRAVSDRGTEFISGNLTVISDFLPPLFSGITPDSGEYRGKVSLTGNVTDDSGKPEVYYRIGSGEYEVVRLSEGEDGWDFSITPDGSLLAGGGGVVTLLARDGVGREAVVRKSYQIPIPGEEPPSVKLYPVSPEADGIIFKGKQSGNKLHISAGVTGLESVTRFTWAIDGGEPSPVNGFPVGTALIDVPEPGSHTLSFRAEYGDGKSMTASRRFTVAPSAGVLSIDAVVTGEDSVPFVQGGDLTVRSETALTGSITGKGKYNIKTLTVDEGEPVNLKLSAGDTDYEFNIPLKDFSYGRHDLHIELEDDFGRKTVEDYFFFVLSDREGRVVNSGEGLYPLSTPAEDGTFYLAPSSELSFFFSGREIVSAGLSPLSDAFAVSFEGEKVWIKADTPEIAEGQILEIQTIDGDLFTFGPFKISSDTRPPELILSSPLFGGYYRDEITLSGSLTDDLATAGIEYSLQDQSFRKFDLDPVPEVQPLAESSSEQEADIPLEESISETVFTDENPGKVDFSGKIDLSDIPDGPVHLRLKGIDEAGNANISELFFIKDTVAPEMIQILPEGNESVNGRFSFMFRGEDEWAENFSGLYSIGDDPLDEYDGADSFFVSMDLSSFSEVPPEMALSLVDTSGNVGRLFPRLFFQPQGDIPEIQIQIPEENFLVQSDLTVSGTIFDDDGVAKIEYKIDNGEVQEIPGGNSFAIPIDLSGLTDNEHQIEIKAFDLWGVESEPVILNFRVSLDVPQAVMTAPLIGRSNRGVLTLAGTAADANGIGSVSLSLDNGNSFHKAEGLNDWTYQFDSRMLVDGNYMIQIKVEDNYGVSAVYSSLITIDNTPPAVQLSNPLDGMGVSDFLTFQMRVSDEIGVEELKYTIRPLDEITSAEVETAVESINEEAGATSGVPVLDGTLPVSEVVIENIDLKTLLPGRYNLSIFAYDDAGNETVVARNILRKDLSRKSVPGILFPFQGTAIQGEFVLEGRIEGDYIPETVTLYKNGNPFDVIQPDPSGYFYRYMLADELEEGELEFQVILEDSDKNESHSSLLKIEYYTQGPWIKIDSVRTGDYVSNRPWIKGDVGYLAPLPEGTEDPSREERRGREVERLEYSLDNGRSFTSFKVRDSWKFRLETQSLQDGALGILVRAVFKNGETAVSQIHVIVDDTPPTVAIVTPEEGLAFNETLSLNGIASDASGLSDVSVMLREGSKNSYEIPSFIQGLYIDGHFLGATFWEVGAGLTFFDDNVKLQALFGMAPQGRFDGTVFGFKLLANIATIPYGYFFGPDFDFLSSSIAIGSAFEYFSMSSADSEQSGLVLGALVGQVELVKAKFPSLPFLNTYSIYFEDQLWFISSDVEGGLENRIAFGVRINVF